LDQHEGDAKVFGSTEGDAEVTSLQSQLDELTRKGRVLSEREQHIKSIAAFTQIHWASDHPDTCPICASDLSTRGGISNAIAEVKAANEADLQETRSQYRSTKTALDAAAERLRKLDSQLPPLQGEQLSRVKAAVELVLDNKRAFDSLSQAGARASALATLEFLESSASTVPTFASEDDVHKAADRGSERLWNAFQKFDDVSEAPEAWKGILSRIYDELTSTMREHLPRTVQALWWEIACNLMPAPWQYPGRVEFQVNQQRSNTQTKVVVRGKSFSPLAAHILNGAELHNLGLAWFVTRHLTFGRFAHSFMILDDPAQQMDQPTFRDFCRLLAVLVRLHVTEKLPLTLVLFLHQDERAMEAARVTDGTLHLLRWHSGQAMVENKYKMRVSPVLPVTPYSLLKAS
jgi:hypothetical protein